jgi:hypothetical protein
MKTKLISIIAVKANKFKYIGSYVDQVTVDRIINNPETFIGKGWKISEIITDSKGDNYARFS